MYHHGTAHAGKLERIEGRLGDNWTGVTKVTWEMRAWDDDELNIDVRVDWEWAKDSARKSTSGMMMINGTVARQWSRTQATSVAGPGYYATVTGTA